MIFSKKKHEVGEIRYLRRFAFFPTDIDDGQYTVYGYAGITKRSGTENMVGMAVRMLGSRCKKC